MISLHQHDSASIKRATPKPQFIPALEQELKRRVGWVDEAISPFARATRACKASGQLNETEPLVAA